MAQLESIQLEYFKRLFGLHRTTHSQFLNHTLGIWPLINYRLVSMIKFWLRVVQLPRDRLLKAAYEDFITQGKKRSWPIKNKKNLDKTGFSYVWNEGRGPVDINTNWENEIKIVLENQMIKNRVRR